MASNKTLAGFKKKANQSKANMIHYFQPIDKGSSMPSWYYQRQVEEEEEFIEENSNRLKRQVVSPDRIEALRAELKMREARLAQIKESQKKTKDLILADKDKADKRFKQLAEDIRDSMPTRDEMNHKPKLIDPRLEAERMGYRNSLVKEYKILGRILGEEVNVEALRR